MKDFHFKADECIFLVYLARRIDCEVDRWQRQEQSRSESRGQIDRLAGCALEILRSADELQAWLEVATQEPRIAPGAVDLSRNPTTT
jgi:hypothetical protein